MFKYFTAHGTRKYIRVLPSLLTAYNNSVHRSTGKRPAWVSDEHKKEVMLKLYGVLNHRELLREHHEMVKRKEKLRIGDTVRRTYELKPGFDKAYYPNWTDETFKVKKIVRRYPKDVYKVTSESGVSEKRLYYPEEVQKITSDGFYRVEKVIRRRQRKGVGIEYLVKYLGYPSTYNQWIPAKNISLYRISEHFFAATYDFVCRSSSFDFHWDVCKPN